MVLCLSLNINKGRSRCYLENTQRPRKHVTTFVRGGGEKVQCRNGWRVTTLGFLLVLCIQNIESVVRQCRGRVVGVLFGFLYVAVALCGCLCVWWMDIVPATMAVCVCWRVAYVLDKDICERKIRVVMTVCMPRNRNGMSCLSYLLLVMRVEIQRWSTRWGVRLIESES